MIDLTIQPDCRQWWSTISAPAEGDLLGEPLSTWPPSGQA